MPDGFDRDYLVHPYTQCRCKCGCKVVLFEDEIRLGHGNSKEYQYICNYCREGYHLDYTDRHKFDL